MVVGVLINQNDGVVQITATGGETDLDFDFPLYAKSHLEIIRTRSGTDTTLVLNTDYTIADGELQQQAGGTAVLTSGATAADVYTLRLNVPESRTTDFTSAGDFLADDLNEELDLITQQLQQLRRDQDRSARLPDSTSLTSLTITPEASKLLRWNSGATGIENVAAADLSLTTVSSFINTLLDDTTAATARSTLDAAQKTSSLTTVTLASGDLIHIADASDSNNEKKALASDIAGILSVPQVTAYTTGSGTYSTPSGAKYLRVRMVGGGGGGAGSGTTPAAATSGGNSTFGTLTANGGSNGVTNGGVAAGGSSSNGDINITGGTSGAGTSNNLEFGGKGGESRLGAGGYGGAPGAGGPGGAGTGYGSGGGGAGTNTTPNTGSGGGAGGYCEKIITSPSASYSYAVGAGGNAGGSGTGGAAGGAGASGYIFVEAFFQ